MKHLALITGAAGGVGLACARLLGRTHKLLLTDIHSARLDAVIEVLFDEGYRAEGLAGDLADPSCVAALAERCASHGAVRSIVNAAGLSPRQADWQRIVRANTIGPVRLLDAVEPWLEQGSACVMIASVAGHLGRSDGTIDRMLIDALRPDLAEALAPRIAAMSAAEGGTAEGNAYSLTKRGIIDLCERRAPSWGEKGARIVSLSPGVIWTSMGRLEADEGDRARRMVDATPVGRWGTAMEIATVAEFLLSDAAAFITGCDVRVDGGAVAAMRGVVF